MSIVIAIRPKVCVHAIHHTVISDIKVHSKYVYKYKDIVVNCFHCYLQH